MAEAAEIKASIRQIALDASGKEYERLADIWKSLETKAQINITIAGIFITGTFAFIRDLTALRFNLYAKCLLGTAILCLVFSVLFSILVLTLRSMTAPPTSKVIQGMADDNLNLRNGETTEQHDGKIAVLKIYFINDQVGLWQKAIKATDDALKSKARFLRIAHWFLMTAIGFVAFLTLSVLFSRNLG